MMWNRGITGLRRFATSSRRLNISTSSSIQQQQQNSNNGTPGVISEIDDEEGFQVQELEPEKESLLDSQVRQILFGETPSNELNKALSSNELLKKELNSFFEEFGSTKIIPERKKIVKRGPNKDFPLLNPSKVEEPYTAQELYLRRENYIKQVSKLGSNLKDVYIPHHEVFYPAPISNISISKLLAAGAHLGHSTSLYRSSNQPYILGTYKGLHIIDLEQTLSHLRRACKIIEGVAERGGIILFIGTKEQLNRPLELAARRCGGFYVSSRWVPGTITNCTNISTWERHEVDFEDLPTGRELNADEVKSIVKPDLVIVLNPVENRVAVKECMQVNIPTIGVIDTDSESTLVTYPIPANDDSIRCLTLLAGILSKAGEAGRKKRMIKLQDYKERNASLFSKTSIEGSETRKAPKMETP